VSDTNVKRNRKHSQILKKKRGCVRLYVNYGLSEFKTIWLKPCPQNLIVKSSTDLCHTCHAHSLTNSGNLTEEEKTEVLAKYQDHIDKVQMQRGHYRKQCEDAKTNFNSLNVENKILVHACNSM